MFDIFDNYGPFQQHFLWVVILGLILAFLLGFGMGANDVSNAFGTSVGSKVLSLRSAYILATIFETLGAILVGYNVTDTMRKGIVDVQIYNSTVSELLVGQLAILGGASSWLILATLIKAPVSTTHSVVGATLGFTLLAKGLKGIQWWEVAKIAASWVVSPLLSGLVSSILYIIVDHSVLRRSDTIGAGMRALPVIYFVCLAFNTFVVIYQGSKIIHLPSMNIWVSVGVSLGVGAAAALIFHFIARPYLLKWISESKVGDVENEQRVSVTIIEDNNNKFDADGMQLPNKLYEPTHLKQRYHPSIKGFIKWFLPAKKREIHGKSFRMFSAIQVFTACFAGFGHGANDVSNAIGPLTALYFVYTQEKVTQEDTVVPIEIMLYGVLATCIGLWILGHRVIKTVGQRMSEINPASGFTIEFGAAVTALLASKAGLPISTTHCLVGSVVTVGSIKSGEGVDWRIFRNIALSWLVTLPVSGAIAALFMLILKWLAL